jgi:hypothetical protein
MTKAGKIDISSMKKFVNKKVGLNIAHDLNQDNPTEVKEWIPTGSRWLDSITCRGKMAEFPLGRLLNLPACLRRVSLTWLVKSQLKHKRKGIASFTLTLSLR